MKGDITMSHKDLTKLEIIQRVNNKQLTQVAAAKLISLSVRQVKRLCQRYRNEGFKGLISKKRGKPSNNQLFEIVKKKTLELIANNYSDFGPTLAHEKLKEIHEIEISLTSVRNIMILNEIWIPHKIKKKGSVTSFL